MPAEPRAAGAVFLSYASQDAEAAKRIADALRAAGVEVWFDQSELVGGDAWDQKIRKQIKDCALLIPIISAATQARPEGYFRLEWRLAVERARLMADDHPFLFPVVIDDTPDASARVPDKFRDVQWTRLSVKDTPESLAVRVGKLLGGGPPEVSEQRMEDRAGQAKQRTGYAPWMRNLGMIAGLTIALVYAFRPLWQPARRSEPKAPVVAPPTAPISEAQKLVTQARKIYEEGDELDRENLFLAEDLVKRALALDSAEPTAWELGAWLSYNMVWQSIDNSGARRDLLMRQATRSRTLAPQSVSAQLVLLYARLALNFALSAVAQSNDLPEIERELTTLARQEPANWQIQRALGTTLRLLNRPDDSIRAMQRAVELSGGNVAVTGDLVNILMRRSRYPEAEALVAPALARRATGRMLTFDLYFKLLWRGDQAAAQAALASWPGWLMQEDRGAFYAWRTWMFARQPEKALALVQRLQRDYLHDANFTGPRAVLSARAHELAGHTDAAAADWRTVAQLADRELTLTPDDSAAAYWKAWALARLGDIPGARTIGNQLQQRSVASLTSFHKSTSMAPLWIVLGQTDQAFTVMGTKSENYNDTLPVTRAMLKLDPAYDALRPDPRFKDILAAALAPEKQRTEDGGRITAPPADDKSVAVLAFANLSDDKANEYFSDGISEELLNVLAKVPGLKVTARTSSFHFKGKDTSIPEIAKQLGVAYVVEGSVRKQGDKVRITAQLIKAADGFHLWSDTFTRDLKDIFAVQDEIAGLIAKNLKLKLGTGDSARDKSTDVAAWQLYLDGRRAWNLRTMEGYREAETLFQRAIALDARFARAYAALADAWQLRAIDESSATFSLEWRTTPTAINARTLIDQALEIDPNCPDAFASLGMNLQLGWQEDAADRAYLRAIELNPNYASAHQWYGLGLLGEGRIDEALAALKRAAELDPLSHRILSDYAFLLNVSGQPEQALAMSVRALSIQPGAVQAVLQQARALALLRRPQEAVKLIEGLHAKDLSFRHGAEVLAILAITGQAEAIRRFTEDAGAGSASMLKFYSLAAVGRTDEALANISSRVVGNGFGLTEAAFGELFKPLREDPRFQKLIEASGRAEYFHRAQAWRAAHPPEKPEVKK